MANRHWLWVLHFDLDIVADCIDLEVDWNLTPPFTRAGLFAQRETLKTEFRAWFAGQLALSDLTNMDVRETNRSVSGSREFVLFPDTMDWPDEVMEFLSPRKPGT